MLGASPNPHEPSDMSATDTSKTRDAIVQLFRGYTLETTPKAAEKVPHFADRADPQTPIYVTFLPGSDFADTLQVTKRILAEGFRPIPHLAARSMPSRRFFEDQVKALTDLGVEHVLCIAGGVKTPLGPFSDTMQLLDTGVLDAAGMKSIGVAGHPEGSPDMSDAAIWAAVKWKNAYNQRSDARVYQVTQFAFEAAPIIAWDRALRAAGSTLPVYVGLPGLATIKTLLRFGIEAGVGPSLAFIRKQAMNVMKLMTVSTPAQQLVGLANHVTAEPDSLIKGVHLYPLGGLKRTAAWAKAVANGDFTLTADGTDFGVDVEVN